MLRKVNSLILNRVKDPFQSCQSRPEFDSEIKCGRHNTIAFHENVESLHSLRLIECPEGFLKSIESIYRFLFCHWYVTAF